MANQQAFDSFTAGSGYARLVQNRRRLCAGVALAVATTSTAIVLNAQNPSPDEVRMSSHPFLPNGIAVKTTLVDVETVVRDENGRTLQGLKAEDFKILDNGKPQAVSAFSVQVLERTHSDLPPSTPPAAPPMSSTELQPPRPSVTSATVATNPARFVAFYFDDLHTDHGDMEHARAAAQGFLRNGFEPGDRIGVFTSSGNQTLEFTDDLDKINSTLASVHPNLKMSFTGAAGQCPQIPAYKSYLISSHLDQSAFDLAVEQGMHCQCPGAYDPPCRDTVKMDVQSQADAIWSLVKQQSQYTMDVLRSLIRHLAAAPGHRLILVASSGFLTETMDEEWDKILTEAVRTEVVINSLDAKGVYTETPGGTAKDPLLVTNAMVGSNPGAIAHHDMLLGSRLSEESRAMWALAEGTGGRFFQNSNDLPRGFRDLAGAPEVSYLLGFDPGSAKPDGKFHNLKVEVPGRGHVDIEARRGYYSLAAAPADQNNPEGKIRQEVMAQDTPGAIPIQVKLAPGKSAAGAAELHVTVHVDPSHLTFQHQRDRNVEQLNFVAALFDAKGEFVVGKEAELDLAFKAPTLERYSREGMNIQMSLTAPAGEYKLRAVVQETVEGKMAAVTQTAEIH